IACEKPPQRGISLVPRSCPVNRFNVSTEFRAIRASVQVGRGYLARRRIVLPHAQAIVAATTLTKVSNPRRAGVFHNNVSWRPSAIPAHNQVVSESRVGEATLEYPGGALGLGTEGTVLRATTGRTDLTRTGGEDVIGNSDVRYL